VQPERNLAMARIYESDITKFLQELKAAKPQLEALQRQGRNLLWDKQIDREFAAKAQAAKLAQAPYVYGGPPFWTHRATDPKAKM
jgi:hypothetical protein